MVVSRSLPFSLDAITQCRRFAALLAVCCLLALGEAKATAAADKSATTNAVAADAVVPTTAPVATNAVAAGAAVPAVAPSSLPNWNQAVLTTTAYGKQVIGVDKRAIPLFWADDVTQIGDLDEYVKTGFNTVVIRLSWRPTPDGAVVLDDLQPQRAFAAAAAARGLAVIYSIPAAPFGMERSLRINGASNSYFMVWDNWVQAVVEELKSTRNLLGWMLPDDPRGLAYFDDISFRDWLTRNYADINVLNRQWASNFESFDAITLDTTQKLITQWRGYDALTDTISEAEMRERADAATRRPNEENFAFHPAALALARFKWTAYRDLLTRWAATIEKADPSHLLFSGRLPDYAQLLSLPPSIDVSVPDIHPGLAENDFATHNPQAVDIARRGGRFAAMPVLSTSGIAPTDTITRLLPAWSDAAVTHGASGLVFDSWRDLQANPGLRGAVATTLQRLQTASFAPLWAQAPVATTAVILTPLADGHTAQMGTDLDGGARGIYGFGEALVNGEPSGLVYGLRWGTAFGSIDYLSPDECSGSNAATLRHYSTLFLPQALSVSPEMAQNLANFAAAGGVVVADLGAGAAQAGGRVNFLPATISALFGVAPEMDLINLSFNLQLLEGHPLLPTWSRQTPLNPNRANSPAGFITAGDGPDGAAFAGPLGFAPPLPNSIQLALAFQMPQQLGAGRNAPMRWRRAMLTLKEVDRGYTIFAPFRLWTFWRPGHMGFDGFHGDLLARGAAVVQQGAQSLVPAPPRAADEPGPRPDTLYPEIVNYAGAIALINHNLARLVPAPAPSNSAAPGTNPSDGQSPPDSNASATDSMLLTGGQYGRVQTAGVGNFLWSNGVCLFPTGTNVPPVAGRPAPIPDADTFESQPQMVTLFATVKPQETTVMRLLPVQAQNLTGGALISHVATYEPQNARFMVWPNAQLVTAQNGDYQVGVAAPAPVRLTLHGAANAADDTAYRVAPNSRHRVTITDLAGTTEKGKRFPPTSQVVTADATGRLKIEATGGALIIEVQPA